MARPPGGPSGGGGRPGRGLLRRGRKEPVGLSGQSPKTRADFRGSSANLRQAPRFPRRAAGKPDPEIVARPAGKRQFAASRRYGQGGQGSGVQDGLNGHAVNGAGQASGAWTAARRAVSGPARPGPVRSRPWPGGQGCLSGTPKGRRPGAGATAGLGRSVTSNYGLAAGAGAAGAGAAAGPCSMAP